MNHEFIYIKENLKRIMQDPDSVFIIRTGHIEKKKALFALVKEEAGVYKNIQLTEKQSDWTFPGEAIWYFFNGPGYFLSDGYITFLNRKAVNITNLEEFRLSPLREKFFNMGLYAAFNDGSATFLIRDRAKSFEKNGGIKPYIKLLKEHKEYNPQFETYDVIENYYVGDDTFVIPQPQEKTSNGVSRKLKK